MSEYFELKNGYSCEIRALKGEDYEVVMLFLRLFSNESIFTNQYPNQPDKDKKESVKMYQDENKCFIGVFLTEGQMIGMGNVSISRPGHPWSGRSCNFGICFLKAYHHMGLGTRLMILLEEWARKKEMHRINGFVRSENRAAIALYLKRGFVIEGYVKETAFINNRWYDEYHIGKILD